MNGEKLKKLIAAFVLAIVILASAGVLLRLSGRRTSKRATPAVRTGNRPKTGTVREGAFGIPILLSFAGDCTFGTVNGDDSAGRFPAVYKRAGRKDYPFALIKPWFANDDLTAVNFECTLKPVLGAAADRIVSLVLARSAKLKYGVKRLTTSRLPQRR